MVNGAKVVSHRASKWHEVFCVLEEARSYARSLEEQGRRDRRRRLLLMLLILFLLEFSVAAYVR